MRNYKRLCKNYDKMVCGYPVKPQEITKNDVKTTDVRTEQKQKITIYFVNTSIQPIERC